jgi:hypothetical protein
MATKKTSMFTLTERITMATAGTTVAATIDLGSYVDVGDRQALQVHSVDFIFQATTPQADVGGDIGTTGSVNVQVQDLNRGGLVFADDRALVASGALEYDPDGYMTRSADLYPDNYGKGSDDGRFVVNDTLYLFANTNALGTNKELNVTVRVNASIVTLTSKDFMAIAIQSTAADN